MGATTVSVPGDGVTSGRAKARMSVSQRLLILSALAFGILAVVAGTSVWSRRSLQQQIDETARVNDTVRQTLVADMLFDTVRADVFSAYDAAHRGNVGERPALEARLTNHMAAFRAAAAASSAQMAGTAAEATGSLQGPVAAFEHAAMSVVTLAFAADPAAADAATAFTAANAALQDAMDAVGKRVEAMRQANSEATARSLRQARNACVATIAVALVLVLGLCAYTQLAIARPLKRMHKAMIALARGDLMVPVPRFARPDAIGDVAAAIQVFKDNALEKERLAGAAAAADERLACERKRAIQATAEAIQNETRTAVEFVTTRSRKALQDVQGVSQQTQDTGEKAALIASVTEGAEVKAERMATAAEQLAMAGDEARRETAQASDVAHDARGQVALAVHSVEEVIKTSKGLVQLLAVIDDVAERTELLALHATIEATRAGDAGKGFVVLAEEVQTLATRTTATTEDLMVRIEDMQSASDRSLNAIQKIDVSVARLELLAGKLVEVGTGQTAAANEIAAGLRQTVQDVHQATRSAQDIARAAETSHVLTTDLEAGVQEIGGSIAELRRTLNRIVRTSLVEAERRRWTRQPASDPVVVLFGGRRIEGRLVDISGGGVRVHLDADLPDGAPVEVLLSRENRAIAARIVQHFDDGSEMGIAFDQPLSTPVAA